MRTIYLAMYKNKKTLTDNLISFVSRGSYSHCEIIVKDNKSTMYSASVRDGNKVRSKLTDEVEFKEENWDIYGFDVNQTDLDSFLNWFETIKNQKYGFSTLFFNHLVRLPIDFKNEMICSEFCTIAMYHLFKSRLSSSEQKKLLNKPHLLTPSNMLARLCEVGIFGHRIEVKYMQLHKR